MRIPITSNPTLLLSLLLTHTHHQTTASSSNTPPPGPITLTPLTNQTTDRGCTTATSLSYSLSPSKSHLTLATTTDFTLYLGPHTSPRDRVKSCAVHFLLTYPADFTFSVVDITYQALSRLDTTMEALANTSISVVGDLLGAVDSGNDGISRIGWRYNGTGVDGEVVRRDVQVPDETRVWAREGCVYYVDGRRDREVVQAELRVDTRVAVQSRSAKVTGRWDGEADFELLVQQVHLGWKRCEDDSDW